MRSWGLEVGRCTDVDKRVPQYEIRCYYFEIVECARKLCLVGLPVFLGGGSSKQKVVGLATCFFSTCLFSQLQPYRDPLDDVLMQLCQLEIFIALAIPFESSGSRPIESAALVVLVFMPTLLAFFFVFIVPSRRVRRLRSRCPWPHRS